MRQINKSKPCKEDRGQTQENGALEPESSLVPQWTQLLLSLFLNGIYLKATHSKRLCLFFQICCETIKTAIVN